MSYAASIVIPIYNVEEYLEECIKSVVDQTIFKELYVVLVDDGSNDNSANIANKYANLFSNIQYVYQENGGLSAARNTGLKYAKGEYITFLDSDDILPQTALENMVLAGKNNKVDIVIGDLKIFPSKKEAYGLWKNHFGKGNKKIEKIFEYKDLVFTSSACNKLFKRSLFNNVTFPVGKHFEDAYVVIPLMLKSSLYLLDEVVYLYRKRDNESSIIDNVFVKRKNFFDHLFINEHIFCTAKKYSPKFEKYVSRFILKTYNGFMSRIPENEEISLEEKKLIFDRLHYMYSQYPEEYFLEMGTNNKARLQYYAIRINDFSLFMNPYIEDGNLDIVDNNLFFDLTKKVETARRWFFLARGFQANLETIDVNEKSSHISFSGYFRVNNWKVNKPFENKITVQVLEDKELIMEIPLQNTYRHDLSLLFEERGESNGFTFDLDLDELNVRRQINKIQFKIKIYDSKNEDIFLEYPLTYKPVILHYKGWYECGPYSLLIDNNVKDKRIVIFIERKSILKTKFRKYLYQKRKSEIHKKGAEDRLIYEKYRKRLRGKEIWLIAERYDTAQDNSFTLFKYLRNRYPKKDVYYLIDSNSLQFSKVQSLGNVISLNSEEHLGYLLNAKVLINSYDIDSYMVPEPYTKFEFMQLFGDILTSKRVFLQHGVTYNDVSIPLNRNRTHFDLVVTNGESEKEFFINQMNYSDNQIIDTGFPRFDLLKDSINKDNKRKKQLSILFMPTWRQYLSPKSYVKKNISKEEQEEYLEKLSMEFTQSDYFKYMSDFLANEELLEFLQKNNIKLQFFPHYELRKFLNLFNNNNPNIEVVDSSTSVQDLLKACDMLITDYSSVFFDVAYMNKPVCYYHFDYEEFYSKHYKKGYFDFKQHGFGPVCYSPNQIIQMIKQRAKNNFENPKKYQVRIRRFFGENYLTVNHCEEVVNSIEHLIN